MKSGYLRVVSSILMLINFFFFFFFCVTHNFTEIRNQAILKVSDKVSENYILI